MPLLNDKDYIINVGPHSTFQRSGSYQTLPEDIDTMFLTYEARRERKIAIYFHGGLVDEVSGLNGARKMAPHIQNGDYAPVCFVWETGLIETISSNLSKISGTKLYNKLLKLLIKKVSEKITVSDPFGRGSSPTGLNNAEIQDELSKPVPFQDFSKVDPTVGGRGPGNVERLEGMGILLEVEIRDELKQSIEIDRDFVDAISRTKLSVDGTGDTTGFRGIISIASFVAHAAKIVYRIIKRFIVKRDHGFYPTVVEEILREFYIAEVGAWIWKSMKDKADVMWKSNSGLQGLDRHPGRYFMDKLIDYKINIQKRRSR